MTTATATTTAPASKGLNIGLWVAQGLLAFAFLGAGMMKLTTPHDQLAAMMPWAADAPSFLPTFIGASEVAGALGLILPAASRIQPILTPIAAAALVVVMVLAAITHILYADFGGMVPSLVLGSLAAFIAWGRFLKAPIAAR